MPPPREVVQGTLQLQDGHTDTPAYGEWGLFSDMNVRIKKSEGQEPREATIRLSEIGHGFAKIKEVCSYVTHYTPIIFLTPPPPAP
jgi:hypothetical protein